MAPCVTPLPARQLDDGDLVAAGDPLEHGPPRGIGKRPHDGVDGGDLDHGQQLAITNALVNTNGFKNHSTEWLTFQGGPLLYSTTWLNYKHLSWTRSSTPWATPRAARCCATLADGERTVGQLAQPFSISLAAASKHIKALENAGLIRREVRGRTPPLPPRTRTARQRA